jgi:hypothetical protein
MCKLSQRPRLATSSNPGEVFRAADAPHRIGTLLEYWAELAEPDRTTRLGVSVHGSTQPDRAAIRGPEDYCELRELQEGAAAKACPRELLPSLAAALIACPVAPSLDNEELAALATVASPVTMDNPDLPSSAAMLASRAATDAVNWSAEALTAASSGSLSLPTGTAVMVVDSVLAESLQVRDAHRQI